MNFFVNYVYILNVNFKNEYRKQIAGFSFFLIQSLRPSTHLYGVLRHRGNLMVRNHCDDNTATLYFRKN